MTIIAFCGRKGHGKDTAGKPLIDKGWYHASFASPMKDMLSSLLAYRGMNDEEIEAALYGDHKEIDLHELEFQSPRFALQTIGTEWGRDIIGTDIWINSFKDHVRAYNKLVLTDYRFPNEGEVLAELGAVRIRITRPDLINNEYSDHISETQIDDLPVEFDIVNDGSIKDLHDRVSLVLTTAMI